MESREESEGVGEHMEGERKQTLQWQHANNHMRVKVYLP